MAKTIDFTNRLLMTILVEHAAAGDTLSYGTLAATYNRRIEGQDRPRLPESGSALGRALGQRLHTLNHLFKKQNAPYLSALVVRSSGADAGIPGVGFWQSIESIEPYFTTPRNDEDKHLVHQQMLSQIFEYWSH